MRNIEACLACHGGTLKDVVRVEVYLKDLGDFDAMNAAYRTHFAEPLPTRATIGAGLVGDILVEIVVMALLGEERGGRP
jgi:2-iminobutanoate/2-iminopropanoate deaminase